MTRLDARNDARHHEVKPLTTTNLWRLAEMLWQFHEAHEHDARAAVMAVHTAVVTEAEARDTNPRARRAAR